MEIPALVEARLGDERPERAVRLGDEDTVFFTPGRTVLYHGKGLLSDESVEVYGHDIERLDLSDGRRKTTFTLTYVGGTEQFSVPRDHSEQVLEGLLAGILGTSGVLADGEGVVSVYRFSELTLVVTDARLVKHVGAPVWDAEYEVFPFAEVTGLEFEDASVATQVVLWVNGHPERIKAPSDEGPLLQQTLTEALCAFHDADSLAQLNDALAPAHDAASDPPRDAASDIALDDSIAPLVSDADEKSSTTPDDNAGNMDISQEADDAPVHDTSASESAPAHASTDETDDEDSDWPGEFTVAERSPDSDEGGERDTGESGPDTEAPADTETLQRQVSELTAAVERQNRLLERHEETIAALLDRLEQRED